MRGIAGALLLARGRVDGIDAYDPTMEDARTVTIQLSMPFPDMDYWGAFMAMGPAPLGKVSDPPEYGRSPLSTGPYKVESFRPSEELVLVKNDAWVADSDPARHQYADKWIAENKAGRPWFKQARQQEQDLLIEKVGVELRDMMPFLNAKRAPKNDE